MLWRSCVSALPPLLPRAGPLALGEHVTESLVFSAVTLSLTGAPVLESFELNLVLSLRRVEWLV